MRHNEVKSRIGSKVVISSAEEERVEAYLPPPLPPDPPVNMEMLTAKLGKAHWVIGRLDGMTATLPDSPIFLYTYVRQEALLSSQIKGTRSSLSDLLFSEVDGVPRVPLDDVREVSSYVAAMVYGLKRIADGFPLSQHLMREIHEILLPKDLGSTKLPGEFRRSQNWIGGSRLGNALYIPPPPWHVPDLMNDLEKFIHTDYSEYTALVKAGLMHVQFETIHPFLEGNGRLGRLMITLLLCTSGLLRYPTLYLSLYFKTHRSRYYELLQRVRTRGDWEAWLEFFLDGVINTSEHAIETAQKILELFERDHEKIQQSGKLASSPLRIHRILQERPVLSAPYAVKSAGISLPTVYSAIRHLQGVGIVKEVTGKKKNRIFVYDEYFRILSGTSDPVV